MTAVELNKMRVDTLPDEKTPEERKKTRRKLAKAKRKREHQESMSVSAAAAKDRKLAVTTVVVLGFIMVGIIFISAYCASLTSEINKANKEIAALQEDIDYLKLEIESGLNIATIEEKALKELGMIYPTADQFVYVEGIKPDNNDMAQAIKESAYESK
jgi:cell division protein FtsL